MSTVEITYSSKGLREIIAGGEEVDCSAIRGQPIPAWFRPALDGQSGWKGLLPEIRAALADSAAEPEFVFYGPRESREEFFRALTEYGANEADGEKQESEQLEKLLDEGRYEEAVPLLQKFAERGDAKAQYHLAGCCFDGKGTAEDYSAAFQWYKKAAEQGYIDAYDMLALCYSGGFGVAEDGDAADQWTVKKFQDCREAAKRGDAEAQDGLASCYYFGIGTGKDFDAAVQWYRRAAEQGHVGAQTMLGECYLHGKGVTKDENLAVSWYRKAAEQGNAYSQYRFACCYDDRLVDPEKYMPEPGNYEQALEVVEEAYKEAFQWYQRSAEQGFAAAQCDLGADYALGCGTEKDFAKAEYWLKLAAERKYAPAYYWLAEVIYARNVCDHLSDNWSVKKQLRDFHENEEGLFPGLGLLGDLGSNAIKSITDLGSNAFQSFTGLGGNTIKSFTEKNAVRLFLKTEAGQEMLSLYASAADHGVQPARKKLTELHKYL